MTRFVLSAAADFLMGAYLAVVACQDLRLRNSYNAHALQWMRSVTCTAAGLLAMVSSEVSIVILTYLSIERYIMIVHPYSACRISFHVAAFVMGGVWGAGVLLAALPVLMDDPFYRFYGSNGVCFPLHLHEPYADGWPYSVAIFVGLNSLAMTVIAFCYISIFRSIKEVSALDCHQHLVSHLLPCLSHRPERRRKTPPTAAAPPTRHSALVFS